MNTWMVARHPIGFHSYEYKQSINEKIGQLDIERIGEKTFFIKSRIMAGQANLESNKFELKDFRWLSKDEISKLVHPSYWRAIRNMLVEQ